MTTIKHKKFTLKKEINYTIYYAAFPSLTKKIKSSNKCHLLYKKVTINNIY